MQNYIVYELPLNEKIRTFLRLEFLFQQAYYTLRTYSVWDTRSSIQSLLDIMSILGNNPGLKNEIIKELEKHHQSLAALQQIHSVDQNRLQEILDALTQRIQALTHNPMTYPSKELQNNTLLSTISKRMTIPGGMCDFDLPAYHLWLEAPAEKRIAQLESWFSSFDELRLSIELILNLLRDSAVASEETVKNGIYQHSFDSKNSPNYQLIRVFLPAESNTYAEICGGKFRFTIRFLIPSENEKDSEHQKALTFKLACCAL